MDKMMPLGIGAGVVTDNKLIFSATYLNGIFLADLLTHKITYICEFPSERLQYKLHLKAYCYNNNIWFIPYQGEYISCFDIHTHEIKEFNIWNYEDGKYAFIDVVKNKEFLYLVPRDSDYFIEVNMRTKSFRQLYIIEAENKGRYRSVVIIDDTTIGLVTTNGELVKTIDINNGKVTDCEPVIEGHDRFLTLVHDKNRSWFIPFTADEIRCYEIKRNEYRSYPIDRSGIKFYGGIIIKNRLVCFPFSGGSNVLVFDSDDYSVSRCVICESNKQIVPIGVSCIESDDSVNWLATENGYLIRVVNDGKLEFDAKRICIERKYINEMLLNTTKNKNALLSFLSRNVVKEGNGVFDLDLFLGLI